MFIANEERKALWPSLAEQDPDLLLSIGTGYDPNQHILSTNPGPRSKAGIEGHLRRLLKIAMDAIQDNLDCEKTWKNFITALGIQPEDEETKRKYQRLNPDFTDSLPKLDEVARMNELEEKTEIIFLQHPLISEIANTLIATLFYFEIAQVTLKADRIECKGKGASLN